MRFVSCTHEQHSDAILEILNDVILNTTALYDYRVRPAESMAGWFRGKEAEGFPVIGAISDDGRFAGFASYGRFRAWPAYKYSVEHSVYVHRDHRRRGVGLALMERLIAAAEKQQYHVIIGGVDSTNSASIRLHKRLGFSNVGTIREVAYKFGRWLDLIFYQLLLKTPCRPVEFMDNVDM